VEIICVVRSAMFPSRWRWNALVFVCLPMLVGALIPNYHGKICRVHVHSACVFRFSLTFKVKPMVYVEFRQAEQIRSPSDHSHLVFVHFSLFLRNFVSPRFPFLRATAIPAGTAAARISYGDSVRLGCHDPVPNQAQVR